MAPVASKTQVETTVSADQARKQALMRAAALHAFQSVSQHVLLVQSEPMLLKELCLGDTGESARLLANTAGLVGILGLFANQMGGKLSDVYGRKPFLMMGPLMNILFGGLIYTNSQNKALVLACRVARMVVTTFSNTVIVSSSFGDALTGDEHKAASVQLSAAIGASVVLTPFVEGAILQRTGHPKYSYLFLAIFSAIQTIVSGLTFPETLEYAKRAKQASLNLLSCVNPLAFLNIYRRGSRALSGLTTVMSFQLFLDGRNLSDITEIWKRNHLGWTMEQSRNFIALYGVSVVGSSMLFGERFLKVMTNRQFTSFANWTSALGFFLRGTTKSWLFILSTLPMLPGVNGASTKALASRCAELVRQEGFGQGEFQAWSNNLRAVGSAVGPVVIGNYYAWCMKRGVFPGSAFWVLAMLGAITPELLMRFLTNEEVEGEGKKKTVV